jgi:hypothetical protein
MKPPKRLFRQRQRPESPHDRRRVDYAEPLACGVPDLSAILDLSRHVVKVPVHRFIDTDTYDCLRGLEDLGVRVDYSKGASAIDLTRSVLATDAVREGMESILFIDSDMFFNPADAVKLLLSDAPVIAGAYAAKKLGNADFGPWVTSVNMGHWAKEPIPVRKVGTGMMRIKTSLLVRMRDELELPYCRMAHTYGWPFFMPVIVQEDGETRYLAEDYAFCWRCHQLGVAPMVDTSFRLYHLGDYAYGWEEGAGDYIPRGRNIEYQIRNPPNVVPSSQWAVPS